MVCGVAAFTCTNAIGAGADGVVRHGIVRARRRKAGVARRIRRRPGRDARHHVAGPRHPRHRHVVRRAGPGHHRRERAAHRAARKADVVAVKPVTLSLKITVHDTLAAFVGVVPTRLIDCTVGAVVSTLLNATLLSVLVDARLALPAASVAAPAGTLTTTVPAPVIPDTATLYVGPTPRHRGRERAARRPAQLTSPVAKSVTVSLKVTVKLIGLALVGSAWPAAWLIVTLGASYQWCSSGP